MIRVLITNGDNIRTLSFFRAICENPDLEVHVAAERSFSAVFFSRFCRHKLINVNPKKDWQLFLRQIADYCKENRIDVLVPMNADELELILKNRARFVGVEIPFSDYAIFRKVKDKWAFYRLALKHGLKAPKTVRISSKSQLDQVTFPAIVKIRTGAGSKGVKKVSNKAELLRVFEETVRDFKLSRNTFPIVQEYLSGENLCVAAMCRNGKVLSVMAFKSLRQWPVAHGTSTSRISIRDETLCSMAKSFLEKLGWNGIAQFDVIKKGGDYFFLELNPRVYTSISVTVASGLNYPLAMCDKSYRLSKSYAAGVKCKIQMADKLVFLTSRYPVAEFFEKAVWDDFTARDPLPSIPLLVKFLRKKLV